MFNLSRCLEKQNQQLQIQTNSENCDQNANDLDLYHSAIRFLRYGNQVPKCKSLILESRLLVHLCRTMYRYNKYLTFLNADGSTTVVEPCEKPSTTPTNETIQLTTESVPVILIKKKSHLLCKDLIKHYLTMLDHWPQPICSEFYNQVGLMQIIKERSPTKIQILPQNFLLEDYFKSQGDLSQVVKVGPSLAVKILKFFCGFRYLLNQN